MNCPNCKTDFKFNADKPIVVMGVPMLDATMHFTILQQWDYIIKNFRSVACVQESTYVDMARNAIVVQGFARSQSVYGASPDYFLFIDSDSVVGKRDRNGSGQILPWPQYINDLIARDKDAISGYYIKKADGYAGKPVFGVGHTAKMSVPDYAEDLQECEWFGGGYLLVKADVFKKVEGPWFENRNDGFGLKGARIVGEDVYFCKKLATNGYKLFVDLKVPIGHHGSVAWPPSETGVE